LREKRRDEQEDKTKSFPLFWKFLWKNGSELGVGSLGPSLQDIQQYLKTFFIITTGEEGEDGG
jgi:hypothetical protein